MFPNSCLRMTPHLTRKSRKEVAYLVFLHQNIFLYVFTTKLICTQLHRKLLSCKLRFIRNINYRFIMRYLHKKRSGLPSASALNGLQRPHSLSSYFFHWVLPFPPGWYMLPPHTSRHSPLPSLSLTN